MRICANSTLEGFGEFSPTPWIRGRVTQPKHALTCSPHSWRAGRGGGACNMTPPLINKCIKHSTSLCAHSLHSQHASSFQHETLHRVKLGQDNDRDASLNHHHLNYNAKHDETNTQPEISTSTKPPAGFHCTETMTKQISANTRTSHFFSTGNNKY